MVSLAGTALQAASPGWLLALPAAARGAVAFATVLGLGAALRWRAPGALDRAVDAALDRPLSSLGYGVAAHGTLVFAGAYVTSQLAQLELAGRSLGPLGLWAGVGLLAVAAGFGFAATGTALVDLRGGDRGWTGVVVGAGLAGLAGVVDPLVGGVLWLVVAATGVGGPVRAWLFAAEEVDV